MYTLPKVGDIFTEEDQQQYRVNKIFEVQGDQWIEFYNELEQPSFCKLDAFLSRFTPISK